jgi:peptide/nickel transport system substrate-binding protein
VIYNTGHGIVPAGFDPKNPIGTGPFRYQSFTPGMRSVFLKNEHYWRTGEPYVDSLVITEYADETSQVNALLSGQVNCIDQLTQASVAALKSGGQKVVVSNGAGSVPFTMRLDAAPFSDVRVRQALRLVVDRPQMRETVQGGYGLLGNDVFAIIDPEYNHSLPQRQQDIDQAKSLLKQAGQEGMTITLVTAPIRAGAVESATVFKQQAAQAGVTVNLDTITSGAYFAKYGTWDFAPDFWSYSPYITQATYSAIPGAAFDATHWGTSQYIDKYMSFYRQALAATTTATQTPLVHEMMTMDYNEGGYILPTYSANIVAFTPSLNGVMTGLTGQPFVEWRFRDMWIS